MTLYDELCEALHRFPRVDRYELYCHPSVYQVIRRIGDRHLEYAPLPLDMLFGADVVVAPELGPGVWEIYGNGKLIDYGVVKGNDAGLPVGNSGNGKVTK